MKTQLLSIFTLLILCMGVNAQNVINIPDANFKTYLVNNHTINTNQDTEIQESEAIAFAGSMFCDNKSISDLTGIEAFPNLVELFVHDNNLTTINVSNNTALNYLDVSNNSLSSIDASAIVGLRQFDVSDNLISSLDVSSNTFLTSLYCYNNNLTSLDVSNSPNLLEVYCQNNALTSLNVAYGNNSPDGRINTTGNPNLTCIEVDNVAWSTTNWSSSIDASASFSTNCPAPTCTVNIPDVNFKAYLVGNAAINTNGDTEISCDEATDFTGTINVNNLGISNLTGIESFTSLTKLYSASNQLTSLDVSSNTALTYLTINDNQLTSLDISVNTALTYLNYSNNQISTIDLSNNIALEYLFANNNQISSLDLSNNTALVKLACTTNQLTSLNLSANTALLDLNCSLNQITSLDLSANTALTKVYVVDNLLTSLDVLANTMLESLLCNNNQITSLDISANTMLENLLCDNNQLTSLNVANGNNANFGYFNATVNSNLSCITVDNVSYSDANWAAGKDATASFSTNCAILIQRTLTINVTNGTVTTNPNPTNGTYANGTVVGLTAIPDTGYQFDGWSGAASGVTTTASVTMNANKTVTATFSLIPVVQRTLTINATNGTITTNPNPTNGTYANGTVVGLTAIPAAGYQFDGWSGAASGTNSSINITMNANKTVTATFSLRKHTLTLNGVNGNIVASPLPINGTYNYGDVVTLTATPNPSFGFVDWSGDITGGTNPMTIRIDADKTINANFSTTASVSDENKMEFSIYPNPTTSILNIKMNSNLKRATIYSILGTKILETTANNIEVSNFKSGIYLLKVEDENGSISTKRFIKNE